MNKSEIKFDDIHSRMEELHFVSTRVVFLLRPLSKAFFSELFPLSTLMVFFHLPFSRAFFLRFFVI